MEKRLYLSSVYNEYGIMLTDLQKLAFEMHYHDDFSLSEIAEQLGITRQAVNDLLKRTEKLLVGYEAKLGLCERHKAAEAQMQAIAEYLSGIKGVCFSDKEAGELTGMIAEMFQLI